MGNDPAAIWFSEIDSFHPETTLDDDRATFPQVGCSDGWCHDQGRAVSVFPPGCAAARNHRRVVRSAG
ncbi:MAG: hypothetical protein ACYDH1_04780 [Anaerolineaceae bacterium]